MTVQPATLAQRPKARGEGRPTVGRIGAVPPDLRLLPPSEDPAQGWAAVPVWLVVTSTDGGPEVHVLARAFDGLWEEIAAEAAAFALEVDADGGPGAM